MIVINKGKTSFICDAMYKTRLWFHFQLGNILIKFYVMLYQCKQVTSYWGDDGNMIGMQVIMGLKIGIPL